MIVYFSATGTNKYVAQELARATGEEMTPLKELVRQEKYRLTVLEGEDFGVVMPTYWEGLPSILLDYLEQAEIELLGSNHYCYFVATYGCDYGNILSTAQKEFGRIGIHFDSLYAARFVDNWSPMFYLKDKERNRRAEENGEAETKRIVQQVMAISCPIRCLLWELLQPKPITTAFARPNGSNWTAANASAAAYVPDNAHLGP